MSKTKKFFTTILLPTKKYLFFFSLGYYALVALFMVLHFYFEAGVKDVFVYTWTAFLVLLAAYILYGYVRLIAIKIIEKKRTEGVIKALKTDKSFRSIFTRAGGIIANFAFVGWNFWKAIMANVEHNDTAFYWMLAEFFWFAATIKLYLDYCADHKGEKKQYASYLITNCLLLFLSIVVMVITIFVIMFDGIFQKSWTTVFPIALFTVYKIVSAILALDKARKSKSEYDWTFASVTFSCALYSLFTLVSSMLVLFSGDVAYKNFSYIGFIVSALITTFAIIGIVRYSKKIDVLRKSALENDAPAPPPDETATEQTESQLKQ